MRIVNKTAWRTEDLRRFAEGAAKERSFWPCGIVFLPSLGRTRGRAVVGPHSFWYGTERGLGRHSIKVWLPPPHQVERLPGPEAEARMAEVRKALWRVLLHEIDHNRGLHHKDMRPIWELPVDGQEGLLLRRQDAPVPIPRTERTRMLVAGREQAARARLADWERRLKAAQRKVREYRGKVRGYERRAAAKAAASPERMD